MGSPASVSIVERPRERAVAAVTVAFEIADVRAGGGAGLGASATALSWMVTSDSATGDAVAAAACSCAGRAVSGRGVTRRATSYATTNAKAVAKAPNNQILGGARRGAVEGSGGTQTAVTGDVPEADDWRGSGSVSIAAAVVDAAAGAVTAGATWGVARSYRDRSTSAVSPDR
jgi:hypothetical protein